MIFKLFLISASFLLVTAEFKCKQFIIILSTQNLLVTCYLISKSRSKFWLQLFVQ